MSSAKSRVKSPPYLKTSRMALDKVVALLKLELRWRGQCLIQSLLCSLGLADIVFLHCEAKQSVCFAAVRHLVLLQSPEWSFSVCLRGMSIIARKLSISSFLCELFLSLCRTSLFPTVSRLPILSPCCSLFANSQNPAASSGQDGSFGTFRTVPEAREALLADLCTLWKVSGDSVNFYPVKEANLRLDSVNGYRATTAEP